MLSVYDNDYVELWTTGSRKWTKCLMYLKHDTEYLILNDNGIRVMKKRTDFSVTV